MKKLTLFLLAMVLGLLFLAVGKANAEGAWILWFHTEGWNNEKIRWLPIEGFQTYNNCKKALDDNCKSFSTTGGWTNQGNCDFMLMFGDRGYLLNGYKCLPESIDPRK